MSSAATNKISVGRAVGIRPRELVSCTVAGIFANVTSKTIRRWVDAGRLTGYRAGPKLVRVDLNELEALLVPLTPAAVPPDPLDEVLDSGLTRREVRRRGHESRAAQGLSDRIEDPLILAGIGAMFDAFDARVERERQTSDGVA